MCDIALAGWMWRLRVSRALLFSLTLLAACGNRQVESQLKVDLIEDTLKLSPENDGVETRLNLRVTNLGANEFRFDAMRTQYVVDGVELSPTTTTPNTADASRIPSGRSIDLTLPIVDTHFAAGLKRRLILDFQRNTLSLGQTITVDVTPNSNGMYEVAVRYQKGIGGLPQDERKAADLYKRAIAVDGANTDALFNLATMYFNGQGGLKKDDSKAVELFQKAADHGDTGAAEQLRQLRAAK